CLTQAQDGDRIRFGVTGTINLTRALPDLTRSISIDGPGANLLTVRRDTGGSYRIFTVAGGTQGAISGQTVANGGGAGLVEGGGIFNAGTLKIAGSIIQDNSVSGAGSTGGGIHNSGTLTVTRSILRGNAAFSSGGGIWNTGTLAVTGS